MGNLETKIYYVWATLKQKYIMYGQLKNKKISCMGNFETKIYYVWATLKQKDIMYGQL